jgi:hypothetical protein
VLLFVFLFLRGFDKSINSSPSGFFLLAALADGREILRRTRTAVRRPRMGLRRRAEPRRRLVTRFGERRFVNWPVLLRLRRVLPFFFFGLMSRTRLNCGICFSLSLVAKIKTPRHSSANVCT